MDIPNPPGAETSDSRNRGIPGLPEIPALPEVPEALGQSGDGSSPSPEHGGQFGFGFDVPLGLLCELLHDEEPDDDELGPEELLEDDEDGVPPELLEEEELMKSRF